MQIKVTTHVDAYATILPATDPYVTFLASLLGHQDITCSVFYETTRLNEDIFLTAGALHWVESKDSSSASQLTPQEIFFKKMHTQLNTNHVNIRLMNGESFIVGERYREVEMTKSRLVDLGFFSMEEMGEMATQCVLTFQFPYPCDLPDLIQLVTDHFDVNHVSLDVVSNRAREIEILIDYLNSLSTPEETFMLDGRFQDKLEEIDNRVYVEVANLLNKLDIFFGDLRSKRGKLKRSSPEYDALKKLCKSFGSDRDLNRFYSESIHANRRWQNLDSQHPVAQARLGFASDKNWMEVQEQLKKKLKLKKSKRKKGRKQ